MKEEERTQRIKLLAMMSATIYAGSLATSAQTNSPLTSTEAIGTAKYMLKDVEKLVDEEMELEDDES